MSNIWNFKDPMRCGFVKLAGGGKEKYGTVIKSGFMRKTVTVRVDTVAQQAKYKNFFRIKNKFQVHDEDEICRPGDKIVLRLCFPVSKLKHYYVRNIVWMIPRHNFTIDKFLNFEKRALLYNDNLRNSVDIVEFRDNERI